MEVKTPNSEEYTFFPVDVFRKTIAIKAPHDAHISFTSDQADTTPMVEFILGGWKNTKSVIRFNQDGPEKATEDTVDLLSPDEHRDFTFEWKQNGTLFQVYGGSDTQPFLSWRNQSYPFQVTHFGVRTSWGATGEWLCDGVNYIKTEDTMEYNYNPVEPVGGHVEFKVKATNDASVCLTTGPSVSIPIDEVILGGWDNTKSAIRHNMQIPHATEKEMAALLSPVEYRSIKIDWNHGEIKVRLDDSSESFMEWYHRETYPVSHFGIRTAYGSEGSWILPCEGVCVETGEITFGGGGDVDETAKDRIRHALEEFDIGEPEPVPPAPLPASPPAAPPPSFPDSAPTAPPTFPDSTPAAPPPFSDTAPAAPAPPLPVSALGGEHKWVALTGGSTTPGAVVGGEDGGQPVYVGRAQHEGDLLPGKFVAAHGVLYVPYGGREHGKTSYELLVADPSSIAWVPASNGSVPENAIPGGETEFRETLYIGRTPHKGTVAVGKIHPSHQNLYISYGGEEIGYPEYEVLVRK